MTSKILHRIYFGFDGKPDPYERYLKTWEEQLPEYKIMHWNAENLPLDACKFSQLMFEARDHAFLSDYFRWWVLREHGGVYLDADIEVISGELLDKMVSELDDKTHSFIGIDNKEGGWYTGHSMGCIKGSPLAEFMCETYEGLGNVSVWRRKIFYFMSPQMTSLYFSWNGHNVDGMGTSPSLNEPTIISGVKVYPQDYLSPLTPCQDNDGNSTFTINSYTKNTAICHHFSCSWHDADSEYLKGRANLHTSPLLNELVELNVYRGQAKESSKYKRVLVNLGRLLVVAPKKIIQTIKNS
ncbi:glycosyltransferase family 32 protein [Vibrio barjaei]|uniref:glycosyltransferase family 32 protein n=1 Tax=Vibrio barjaei TaxID=1676683 RepID=UPI0007BC6A07|nr:glycosyltransferase [Vibrio barjaei]OIN25466.1 hypothetical protein AWH66_2016710 [Vibrio barjaei]